MLTSWLHSPTAHALPTIAPPYPQFLKSISPAQIELMQRKIAMVWHRCAQRCRKQPNLLFRQEAAVPLSAHRRPALLHSCGTTPDKLLLPC